MKKLTSILLGLLIFSVQSLSGQFGQVVINHQPIYEEENNYFPHDHFVKLDMGALLDTAVSIQDTEEGVTIRNIFNDGYMGHSVCFLISPELEIMDIQYHEWTDIFDGSQTTYTVEKAILSLNINPFESQLLTGHYTLQIREDHIAGEFLRRENFRDTTRYSIFNGKFKNYSELEKQRGRDWVIGQNEINMGIKDSFGVYQRPDVIAQYKYGNDSLNTLLNRFKIERSETGVKKKASVTLKMLIDKNGHAIHESMTFVESVKEATDLLEKLRSSQDLTTNWFPAKQKGRPVKSEVYLTIGIKE